MYENDESVVSIKRSFNAAIQLVWDAWTKAEHIANWWGPEGMETKVEKHDFRVGGEWKYVMAMPNGGEFIGDGVFSVIVPLEKIRTSANFKPMTVGVEMESLFKANGNKTDYILHVIHPTKEYAEQQIKMGFEKGWASTFDRLETFLQK